MQILRVISSWDVMMILIGFGDVKVAGAAQFYFLVEINGRSFRRNVLWAVL